MVETCKEQIDANENIKTLRKYIIDIENIDYDISHLPDSDKKDQTKIQEKIKTWGQQLNEYKKNAQKLYTDLAALKEPQDGLSPENWQCVLREVLDLRYDVESKVTSVFQSLNKLTSDVEIKEIQTKELRNEHCDKNYAYYLRRAFTNRILKPISDKLIPLRGKKEGDKTYKIRKFFGNHIAIIVSQKMRESVNILYNDFLENSMLPRNLNEENCYKLLNKEEQKWVIREVDMMKKMDSINIYKLGRSDDFRTVMDILCAILFGYNTGLLALRNLFGKINRTTLMLFIAIPELCNFAFPNDTSCEAIQEVTLEQIQYAIEYNENWELDAATMYWMWTHISGERDTKEITDLDGNTHPVPKNNKSVDYLSIFINRVKSLISTSIEKISNRGMMKTSGTNTRKLYLPWTWQQSNDLTDETFDSSNMEIISFGIVTDAEIAKLISDAQQCVNTKQFLEFFNNTLARFVPDYVWKSFSALSGKVAYNKPLKFLPNNATLYDMEYEFKCGCVTVINSILWQFGYLNNAGISVNKGQLNPTDRADNVEKGGLCYKLPESNKESFSRTVYDPFTLLTYFIKQNLPEDVTKAEIDYNNSLPTVNNLFKLYDDDLNGKLDDNKGKYDPTDIIGLNKLGYETSITNFPLEDGGEIKLYKWPTASRSFWCQDMYKIRAIPYEDQLPFVGAKLKLISPEILNNFFLEYLDSIGNATQAENGFLISYADYVFDNYIVDKRYRLIDIMYENIINTVLKYRITIPYNGIINSNYINTIHALEMSDIGVNPFSDKNFIIPQYIFTKTDHVDISMLTDVKAKLNTISSGNFTGSGKTSTGNMVLCIPCK